MNVTATEPAASGAPRQARSILRGIVALLIRVLVLIFLLVVTVWGAAAIWFDGPATHWLAGALAAVYALVCLALPFRVRPLWRAGLAVLLPFGAVLLWWFSIAPSNDRDWLPDVAQLATAEIEDSAGVSVRLAFEFERTCVLWFEASRSSTATSI